MYASTAGGAVRPTIEYADFARISPKKRDIVLEQALAPNGLYMASSGLASSNFKVVLKI